MLQRIYPHMSRAQLHRRLLRATHSIAASPQARKKAGAAVFAASLASVTIGAWAFKSNVQNEAPETVYAQSEQGLAQSTRGVAEHEGLVTMAWGSNRSSLVSAETDDATIRSPSQVPWLAGVALRDLALHGQHGACVDASGDVYQWGDALHPAEADSSLKSRPQLVLQGQDIASVQLSDTRLFALSSSGNVFVLPIDPAGKVAAAMRVRADPSWTPVNWLWKNQPLVPYLELDPQDKLKRGEKFISISAGSDHLLALTSAGRTFAHPITRNANSHGQLGLRKFDIPTQDGTSRVLVELVPKSATDPFAKSSAYARGTSKSLPPPPDTTVEIPKALDDSFGFCDRLFEVPSLKGIRIAQVVAGRRSSFVRTAEEGRVLGWGANEYGQLGLGPTMTLDSITIPTEVVLSRNVPSGVRSRCTHVATGGDLTYFMVERQDGESHSTIDVLACGMGQWGGLGNGLYSNAQGTPVRVKAVSGLLEYSEDTKSLQPIAPHAISASPTGHVLLTLDTLARAGTGGGGRDLLVWGHNREYQLGNGKRTSVATPMNVEMPGGGRLMMMKKRVEVRDLQGRRRGKAVEVEQRAVAGYGTSLVYWKIC